MEADGLVKAKAAVTPEQVKAVAIEVKKVAEDVHKEVAPTSPLVYAGIGAGVLGIAGGIWAMVK